MPTGQAFSDKKQILPKDHKLPVADDAARNFLQRTRIKGAEEACSHTSSPPLDTLRLITYADVV